MTRTWPRPRPAPTTNHIPGWKERGEGIQGRPKAHEPKQKVEAEAADFRYLSKAKPLNLAHGKRIRIVAGGKWDLPWATEGSMPGVKKREFRICAVGPAGQPASIQVSTPDVRAPGEPYGKATRKILVGDRNKMCRFGWPTVHYESDLLPEYEKEIAELHGRRRRSRRR